MNRRIAIVSEQVESQQDWQTKVEHLEQYVCELLIENQTLRMALQTQRANGQGSGYSLALPVFPSIA
jgi:hypothetical protein